jgi:hypothetical protein
MSDFEAGVPSLLLVDRSARAHLLYVSDVPHSGHLGEQALKLFGQLYDVERELVDADSKARLDARGLSRPVADALHQGMRRQRPKKPDGSATAREIDHSPEPLGDVARIRLIAFGRQNWLLPGDPCATAREPPSSL